MNGWQDNAWGHYFTVDAPINTALGSDFDALVLVGGERSIAKLKTNLHTRRIINHFLEADKPIAAIGAGVALLALSGAIAGRVVASDAMFIDELKAAKVECSDEPEILDGNLLTVADAGNIDVWVEATLGLLADTEALEVAA